MQWQRQTVNQLGFHYTCISIKGNVKTFEKRHHVLFAYLVNPNTTKTNKKETLAPWNFISWNSSKTLTGLLTIMWPLLLTRLWLVLRRDARFLETVGFSLTLSAPNLKMLFWTTFKFSILKAFRKQRIEEIKNICKPKAMGQIPQKIVESQLRRRL